MTGVGHIGEVQIAVVAIEGVEVIGENCDVKVESAIPVVISNRNSHCGLRQACIREGETRYITYIFKGTVV